MIFKRFNRYSNTYPGVVIKSCVLTLLWSTTKIVAQKCTKALIVHKQKYVSHVAFVVLAKWKANKFQLHNIFSVKIFAMKNATANKTIRSICTVSPMKTFTNIFIFYYFSIYIFLIKSKKPMRRVRVPCGGIPTGCGPYRRQRKENRNIQGSWLTMWYPGISFTSNSTAWQWERVL